MGKKRSRETADQEVPADPKTDKMEEDSADDDEDFDMVDVEFEWFNYDPEVDFHGIKALLRQLLDIDSQLFNISALADLILSQPTIGSTVKVDGKATDAYAMMTALNIHEHREKESFASVANYLVEKARTNQDLAPVSDLITGGKHIGLVLSERLINMPSEIGPPMYSMLIDEIEAAVEDDEPYEFSHYLILSKTYQEVESTIDTEDRKKKRAKEQASTWFFHPEDEVLQKHALAAGSFEYTKQEDAVADSKRAFQEMGVKSMGHMMLIEASKFEGAVKAINDYLKPPQ